MGTVPLRIDLSKTTRGEDTLPRPDVGFFGRDETILALDRAFDSQPIVLLHAYAGSGKTMTAAEFARWYAGTGGLRGPILFTSFEQYKPLAEVPSNTRVWLHRPAIQPPGCGPMGRPCIHPRVKPTAPRPVELRVLMNQLPARAWHRRIIKEGGKGPLRVELAFVRVALFWGTNDKLTNSSLADRFLPKIVGQFTNHHPSVTCWDWKSKTPRALAGSEAF